MASTHEKLIARYEHGSDQLAETLRGVPPELLDRQPAPGKWSIRQIVAHIANAEVVAVTRIHWVAAQPESRIPAYDQDIWARELHYEQLSPKQALDLFRALRTFNGSILRTLPDKAWFQIGHHEERGPVSLLQFVELAAEHSEKHGDQIREIQRRMTAAA